MQAKTIKGNSTEEIKDAWLQSMADARPDGPVGRSFQPSLALVFISVTN